MAIDTGRLRSNPLLAASLILACVSAHLALARTHHDTEREESI
jgi:hypothetical protein